MALTPIKFRVPIDMGMLEIISLRLQQLGTDPVTLVNGNAWYNTTQHRAKRVENGVIVPFFSAADAVKLATYETAIEIANAAIAAANQRIADITNDNLLAKEEKPVIVSMYNLLLAEQTQIDIMADLYSITTEKTAYDDAITALTNYLEGLDPAYDDYTQDTIINGTLFRQLFGYVYLARQTLSSKMAEYAHDNLDAALVIANNAKAAADQAMINAALAMELVGAVSNDGILATVEKPAIVQQYNILIGERAALHTQADSLSITTELTNYEAALTALTNYLVALVPAYNNYTESTVIVRLTFNSTFQAVYDTKGLLLSAIYAALRLLADNAAIIARSKGRHFITTPTTPYYVGDIYTNAVDLYRCITERLVGLYNAADWEIATHYDRTKTIIDGGLVTTGRIEVGGGILGTTNAGMNGSVGIVPTTDIRFWAGATYANRTTAPWRVQDDGTFYATQGYIGGWHVDTDSIHFGTKTTGNGYSAAAGSMTLKSDGSLHAFNFYIDVNGDIGIRGVASFKTAVDSNVSLSISGGHIWEDDYDNDESTVQINYYGYNKGSSRFRNLLIGDGKGVGMFYVDGSGKEIDCLYPVTIATAGSVSARNTNAILELQSTTQAFLPPRLTLTQARALRNGGGLLGGMLIFVTDWGGANGQLAVFYGTDFYNITLAGAMGG